jgi:hypothetical protein
MPVQICHNLCRATLTGRVLRGEEAGAPPAPAAAR